MNAIGWRFRVLTLLLLTANAELRAEPPPPLVSGARGDASLTFSDTVDVRLVELAVRVATTRGTPVLGLEAHDFSLNIDGQPVRLSTFSGPTADLQNSSRSDSSSPPVWITMVIDLTRYRRETLTAIASDLIGEISSLTSQDNPLSEAPRIAILTIDVRGSHLVQPFTDDVEAIALSLRGVAGRTPSSNFNDEQNLLAELQQTAASGTDPTATSKSSRLRILAAKIGAYASRRGQQAAAIAESCSRIVDLVSGLGEQQAILLISHGLEIDPGEALLRATRDSADRLRDDGPHSSLPKTIPGGDTGTRAAINALAARGLERGIPIYSYFGSPFRHATDALGAAAPTTGSGGAPGTDDLFSPGLGSASRQKSLLDSSRFLASLSAGRALEDSRVLIGQIVSDQQSTYRLGFSWSSLPSQEDIRISVDTTEPVEVSHHSIHEQLDPDLEAALRTRSSLFGAKTVDQLDAQIELVPVDSPLSTVGLTVRVPFSRITVRPEANAHIGKLSIFVAEISPDLVPEPIRKIEFPIRLGHEHLADAAGRDAELQSVFEIADRANLLAIGIRDDFSSSMSIVTVQTALQ